MPWKEGHFEAAAITVSELPLRCAANGASRCGNGELPIRAIGKVSNDTAIGMKMKAALRPAIG